MPSDQEHRPDPALVGKIIQYLSDPEDPRGVWDGLCFMEQHGLDLSLRSSELHAYLTDSFNSPVENADQASHEEERELLLALRAAVRRQLNLPSLSDQEMQDWQYVRLKPPSPPAKRQLRPAYPGFEPSPQQRDALLNAIQSNDPELLRAMALFANENERLAATGAQTLSLMWIWHRLEHHIRVLDPQLGGVDVSDFAIGMMREETRKSKLSSR